LNREFEGGDGTDASAVKARRDAIYKLIVHPLKTLLQKLGWVDGSGRIIDNDYVEASPNAETEESQALSEEPTIHLLGANSEPTGCARYG
uniref:hypothetical protein n=1 Tax=Thermoanaerobacterium sp. DL9XJH110 TaxID=3386643 RepID=UPI003BB700AE